MNIALDHKRIALKLGIEYTENHITLFNETATFDINTKTGKITIAPKQEMEALINEIAEKYKEVQSD